MYIDKHVINVPDGEYWDEDTSTFHQLHAKKLVLEHSLYTVARWESIWHKCFTKTLEHMTDKEMFSYIKCMIISPENPTEEDVMYIINNRIEYAMVQRYISDKKSATYIRESNGPKMPDMEAKTAELFYYYLVKLRMPVDIFEHWHFNRLMIQLNVFNMKDDTKHKRSIKEVMQDNDRINEERRRKFNSKG